MSCHRAFDVDLVAFVHDARGPAWAEFHEHYLLCRDCTREVRTWSELEIILQGGAPPATTHPAPEDLLAWAGESAALDHDYRRIVDYHVASCRSCADEIAALRAFDFTALDAEGARVSAAAARAGALARPGATNGRAAYGEIGDADRAPAGDEVLAEVVEPLATDRSEATPRDARPGGEVAALPEAPPPPVAPVAPDCSPPVGVAAIVDASPEPASADVGPEPLDAASAAVRAIPDARPHRVARVLRHPAFAAAVVLAAVLPVLWLGALPRFPFGQPAGDTDDVRVAVATVGDLPGAFGPGAEVVRALRREETDGVPEAGGAAGNEVAALVAVDAGTASAMPDDSAPGGAASTAEDLWALGRLDAAGPLEIVAEHIDAGLELEVPVPLTVPAGAVLQVRIRGDTTREIVERLPFPGVREVTVRVPAAWLVPGAYEITLGVVRYGPAPVQVAEYRLIVY